MYRSSEKCKKAYIYVYISCILLSHTDTYKATPEQKLEAEKALAKYDLLTGHDERQEWIRQFELNGGGIGPNALKFASKFDKSLEFNDSTTLKQVEDYYSPGEILQFNGTCIANFPTVDEAVQDAEYLVKKKMEAHGWAEEDHPHLMDELKPCLLYTSPSPRDRG